MKVDLYRYIKIKGEEPEYQFHKTVELQLVPNVYDYYIDEESGNYISVKERFISEQRVVILLGKLKKNSKHLKVLF